MSVEIRVPTLGESVTEATIAQWYKSEGDQVDVDEPLVELETDKVTVEVPAPSSGVLSSISVQPGDTVEVGALLGAIGGEVGVKVEAKSAPAPEPEPMGSPTAPEAGSGNVVTLAPSARKVVEENDLDPREIEGTGRDGRITKGDALAAVQAVAKEAPTIEKQPAPQPVASQPAAPKPAAPAQTEVGRKVGEREERVPMTRLRQTIARRLKDAQNTAAMLTTFNEVDMSNVMKLRSQYKEVFEQKHGVRLGFMSFFVKACVTALEDVPAVNAEVDGSDIIYKNHYDIGVAVGTDRGLVVPVVRDTDQLSLAGIEKAINAYADKARDGSLALEDLQGGTFTISNGGVYGSLMSTPILNAPQSGVLGMHKIEKRPVVIGDEVVVRPMMYLALSYDHRIVDGKEAVTFLVRVKECIEAPQRMLLDL